MTDKPAIEVIVLGPAGGPLEDNVTGIIARSTSTKWSLNTLVAVDAGTLLAGIFRLLQRHGTVPQHGQYVVKEGPFIGLNLPYESARVNAGYIFRELLGTILITHPHLDHLSGLAINTPMLQGGNGPKALAALPSVLASIRSHLFNDIIWPNMSDEDGGAGLLTYQRLIEGGNPRFGRGETLGYVQACHGLLTKCLGVSHGRLKFHEGEPHHHTGSSASAVAPPDVVSHSEPSYSTIESSAFFIRDQYTGREVVVFGDVEPDRISQNPRNRQIWAAAAEKVATGTLRAIFIECSYPDSVDDSFLYGHLCPRHLIEELSVLAYKVEQIKGPDQEIRARHKDVDTEAAVADDERADNLSCRPYTKNQTQQTTGSGDDRSEYGNSIHDETAAANYHDNGSCASRQREDLTSLPLSGLSIYIIHIKDGLSEGRLPSDQILQELREKGTAAMLGCKFHVPKDGEAIWI